MTTVSRDELKQRGVKRFFRSFRYAMDGLKYAFKFEQNLTVHILATLAVIVLGVTFSIEPYEWMMCVLAIGLVIATELINTSIEATIDLVSPEYNKLAKTAKDTASSAVLIFAIAALIIGLIIFVPKIIFLFEHL